MASSAAVQGRATPPNADPLDGGASVNWDAVGAVAELLGVLATIATLIYLARQIRQGADATRFQALQAIRANAIQLRQTAAQSPEVVTIMAKAAEGGELTPAEQVRLNLMYASIFDNLSQSYDAASAGLVGDHSFAPYLRSYLSQEACREWWPEGRKVLSPEFVEHIELHVLPNLEQAPTHWQATT
jgi:hypothetical protein